MGEWDQHDRDDAGYRPRRPPTSTGTLVFRELLSGLTREDAAFSERIPPGMRAVSLELPASRALYGMLRAGDRVDVVASLAAPSGDHAGWVADGFTPRRSSTIILQKQQVLAVCGRPAPMGRQSAQPGTSGQAGDRAAHGAPVETETNEESVRLVLAVGPLEVERLVAAADAGAVWLALVPAYETPRNAEAKAEAFEGGRKNGVYDIDDEGDATNGVSA